MENSRYKFRALFECLTEGTQTWQYLKIGNTIEWHGRGQITDWLQFTGLKDKNGVEIYEGDIIGYFIHTYKVGFHNGSFGLFSFRHDGFIPFFESVELSCEVIGNIHENKELLK